VRDPPRRLRCYDRDIAQSIGEPGPQLTMRTFTGLSRKTITESKDADSRPRITLKDADGNTVKIIGGGISGGDAEGRYFLPVGSNILVNDGDAIEAGDVIAKITRENTKTKDITGGLPRVAELFEARKPKDHAVIAASNRTGLPQNLLGDAVLQLRAVDDVAVDAVRVTRRPPCCSASRTLSTSRPDSVQTCGIGRASRRTPTTPTQLSAGIAFKTRVAPSASRSSRPVSSRTEL